MKKKEEPMEPFVKIITSTTVSLSSYEQDLDISNLHDLLDVCRRQGAPTDAKVTTYSGYSRGGHIGVSWDPS